MSKPQRILLADNSKAYATIVSTAITETLGLQVTVVDNLRSARHAIDLWKDEILLVLSGLVLPDADESQVVSCFTQAGLPLVVVTGVFDTAVRERILAQPVIDYVLKDNPGSVDYVVWLVQRIAQNRSLLALVVDDSRSYRLQTASLLRLYGFTVLEAETAEEAVVLLEANPAVSLMVTDYQLPGMDGVQLVRKVRAQFSRERMAVIGISSSKSGKGPVSAQFIKNGASDFLSKPFLPEELFCRVAQNVESLESIARLRRLATTDPLTGLKNRRSYFESAERRFQALTHQGLPMAVAMIDIDHFKRVNDCHGHDAGDVVLVRLARLLDDTTRDTDVVARLGGEEFCVLAGGLDSNGAEALFERLRQAVENSRIEFAGATIPLTVSIGLCTQRLDSLRAMITAADQALYRAKAGGRNRIEGDW
jgi:diguanylate cyclase (GGDEF)-like protein